ncbi:MAG TPA: rRNA maturation RNase YbeY, partial [Thermodesulfovibrionales bacterium]|nr:rRNA maturation RNase YbeY [Thermodesulfovibrionales bacterium]
MKVYIKNQQRSIKISQQRLRRLLREALHLLELQRSELSILFVNDRRMKILNLQHRGVDRTTDILSFPQFSAEKLKARRAEVRTSGPQSFRTSELLLGDIVINLTRARRQAAENGLTLNEELKRLVIHGLLHLIGHDHEKSRYQKNKMELKERELL